MIINWQRHFIVWSGFIFVLAAVGAGFWFYDYFSARVVWKTASEKAKSEIHSAFTGEGVATTTAVFPRVVGVMIDNHPDAWPQSGVSEAKVVYEALAEGGITRYLALYDSEQTVEKVGPVRSARSYYVDWLREYGDSLYMHSGGSPEALSFIKEIGLFDANEFWWGSFYWRYNQRAAPHNLYTKSSLWQEIVKNYGDARETHLWAGWKYGENNSTSTEAVRGIKIKYSPDYEAEWRYDAQYGRYLRFINGEPHRTDMGLGVEADNVVVQYMAMPVVDEVGRRDASTVGEGECRVLRDGIMTRGIWKKDGPTARTRFYDSAGNEVALKPGITWVEVALPVTPVEVSN